MHIYKSIRPADLGRAKLVSRWKNLLNSKAKHLLNLDLRQQRLINIDPRFWDSSFRQISNKNLSPLVWGIIRAWSTNPESKSRRPYTNQPVTNCDNTQDRLGGCIPNGEFGAGTSSSKLCNHYYTHTLRKIGKD